MCCTWPRQHTFAPPWGGLHKLDAQKPCVYALCRTAYSLDCLQVVEHGSASLISNQERDIAGFLQDLVHPSGPDPPSLEPLQPALQGIATARGMQMSAVAELKRGNLQV